MDGTGSCNQQVWIRKNAAISSQPWLNDREKSILLDEIQSSTPSALVRPLARQANQFAPDKRLLYRVCRVFQFLLCMLCTIWSFTGRKGGGKKKVLKTEKRCRGLVFDWPSKRSRVLKKESGNDEWGGGDYQPSVCPLRFRREGRCTVQLLFKLLKDSHRHRVKKK